ncbi:hypothetical protein DRJ48_03485 [Candidatus Woesearchaeota archaeon]|nr:hypothetical protein [Candidatus Woesearchaeota archaeon]RLE42465.1 MAG: hypothetical protein DRJ48_03485 [Candidatus Woesearchaeota archaeon]
MCHIFGVFLSFLLPYGSKGFALELFPLLIPGYLLSSVIEMPVIYLYLKKKLTEAWRISAKVSFFVNLFSYYFLFLCLLFID